jgi:hypothetical protein
VDGGVKTSIRLWHYLLSIEKKKNVIEFIFELMNSMSSEWLVKVPSVRHQLARVPTTIVDPHSPVNALLLYYEIWFG